MTNPKADETTTRVGVVGALGRMGEQVRAAVGARADLVVGAALEAPGHAGVGETLEDGITPGREAPVFACDFGRIGIQICYDMSFDQGWDQLAAGGAEIVCWPSASPQTLMPALRARRGDCHVVSATMRDNASVYDPLGQVVDRVTPGDGTQILVTEIDLTYLTIDWQPGLRDGAVFAETFGERVGYRYSATEDGGVFWSNDPTTPIRTMLEAVGLDPRYTDWPGHTRRLREAALRDAPPLPPLPAD